MFHVVHASFRTWCANHLSPAFRQLRPAQIICYVFEFQGMPFHLLLLRTQSSILNQCAMLSWGQSSKEAFLGIIATAFKFSKEATSFGASLLPRRLPGKTYNHISGASLPRRPSLEDLQAHLGKSSRRPSWLTCNLSLVFQGWHLIWSMSSKEASLEVVQDVRLHDMRRTLQDMSMHMV